MTTGFRVADRVRATHRNRKRLNESGGTVVHVESGDVYEPLITVVWDSGITTLEWNFDIERIAQ